MVELEYLKHLPIFEELAPVDLAAIDNVTVERRYKKNMIIFMEGEPGEGFHYVKSGKVKIVKMAQDGREHIINILGPGEVFAEVLLFNRGPYPATSVALEDSVIGIIKNVELENVVVDNPRIALHIIRVMNKKLLHAQMKIKTLALSDTFARTAQILGRLAQQYGREVTGGIRIDIDMTRQDLANLVGTTRETVSRVLSSMKKDKVIDLAEQQIIILDEQRLSRYQEM
ncbi:MULTISPECIES: Crp/Fnr family transcriptional regulator [Sporomusa]|uniref:cAMP receptor protein n=1 Tax=Sporomusa sphaeroides DSM 2875 TaxID=1337886 RepID=A0ABM9W193_9FIRM|nr:MULTISPECIES: Crp/Fnr family transcriptional regulator [Sporomusa]MCM0761296.1 Crp/Fnr family transcriptional regulator [Sporomusa sphaeroides DSM 2875]OLS56701.1 cAMP receptor protein [Sporomusa sphaeroides DSM 2875]CVK18648.1 cAMP receptor protein [Sporomusa sphaeroides DSM 2875]HML32692.1 Crp/Fnr family transcriptional regulator [Sporomusa sphaeroides]